MRQNRLNIQWNTMAFAAGGVGTMDLPITADTEGLHLYLSGNIVVGTQYTACVTEGMAKLIQKIEIIKDGETIYSAPGSIMSHGNYPRDGGVIRVNPGVTVATQTGEIVGFIDFAHIGGLNPKDSILRSSKARTFQMRVTWGQFSDMYTGAGAVTSNTLVLKVAVRAQKPQPGEDMSKDFDPELRRIAVFNDRAYANSMTADKIQLQTDKLYKAIILRCETAGDLSTAVLNNVRVLAGSDVLYDLSAAQIADQNTHDFEWTLPGGYYVIPFSPTPHGLERVTDFLDTHGRKDVYLELNVTGGATTKVQVQEWYFEILPHAVAANASKGHKKASGVRG